MERTLEPELMDTPEEAESYDAMDNRTTSEVNGRRARYRYDWRGRLVSVDGDEAVRQQLAYDARGRLTRRTSTSASESSCR